MYSALVLRSMTTIRETAMDIATVSSPRYISTRVNSNATQPASAAAGSEIPRREEGEKRLFPELLGGHAHSC